MTLTVLHQRIGHLALRRRVTIDSIISESGIRPSTMRRAVRGDTAIDTATAARLLPLVAAVAEPGEPVALLLTVPGVAAPILLSPATP